MQRACTDQVWIILQHYGSESDLVNALLCDEILNLLKLNLQDYICAYVYGRSGGCCTDGQRVLV